MIVPGHPARAAVASAAALGRTTVGAGAATGPDARIMSICTGAFVLAAAGLLDGRPATTHWLRTPAFRAVLPGGRLDPDVLFVDDGDVLTSAGVAAGIDLCLHVDPPRPRHRGRQPGGPAQRGAAVARRRAGAVHRAAVPEPRGTSTGRDPRVGARPARRAADPGRSRRARRG